MSVRPSLVLALTLAGALCSGCAQAVPGQGLERGSQADVRARDGSMQRGIVREVDFDARLRVSGKGWVRLQGLEAPREKRARARLRGFLRDMLFEREVRMRAEGRSDKGFELVLAEHEGASVNEAALEAGLAWFRTRSAVSSAQARLVAATERAKADRRGLWKDAPAVRGAPPPQRGGVLGLYFKVDRPYHTQVDRVAASGADWIQLLLTVFVDGVTDSRIRFDPRRTVRDERLRETIRYARSKGLRVALLPIVLIRGELAEDDWRGTLRPEDPPAFWRSYDAFLARYLDIAREETVELFHVGSELCSLESSHAAWRRVIENARGRYAGWLAYSANWDHHDVPRFWPLLDQVGLTAYFELTESETPSRAQLVAAWRRVRAQLEKASAGLARKLVLTELGYASQDGCNTAPWNYLLTERVDLDEQAACFEAFAEVMLSAPAMQGYYVYGYFERGGPDDASYAVWGKPAFDVVKRMNARFRR